jgi:hypothetical protein
VQEPVKIEEKIIETVKWVPVYEMPQKIEMKSDKLPKLQPNSIAPINILKKIL